MTRLALEEGVGRCPGSSLARATRGPVHQEMCGGIEGCAVVAKVIGGRGSSHQDVLQEAREVELAIARMHNVVSCDLGKGQTRSHPSNEPP